MSVTDAATLPTTLAALHAALHGESERHRAPNSPTPCDHKRFSPALPRLTCQITIAPGGSAPDQLTSFRPASCGAPMSAAGWGLFDLRFLEGNVLARNRIVLLEGKFVGCSSGVLLRDIEETGACRAQQLDLLGNWLGHDSRAQLVAKLTDV